MKQQSLRSKFVRSISMITLLILILTSAATLALSINLFWNSTEDFLEQSSLLGQSIVSGWFKEKELLLETVSDDMRLFTIDEKNEIEDYFSLYANKYDFLVDMYIGTPDNRMYSGTYWVPDEGYDVRTRDWYIEARSNPGVIYYSEPYIDAMSQQMVITISTTTAGKNGQDFGVIGMDLILDNLVAFINDQKIETSGRAFLLDSNNNFIAHQNSAFLPYVENDIEHYTNFSDTNISVKKWNSRNGVELGKGSDHNDNNSYITLTTIPENGWSYGFSVPTSDFNSVFYLLILQWVIISFAMVGLSILFSNYMTKRLLVPINSIIGAAGSLAKGNVNVDLEVNTNDEFGKLSEEFKTMLSSTAEQIDAMERISSGDLTVSVTPKSSEDILSIKINEVVGKLRDLITGIQTTAKQVANGSDQIASGSQSLAQGATEQSASVAELSSSLDSIAKISTENAEGAVVANAAVIEIRESANQGTKAMDAMMAAVEAINESAENISKIIKTIDEIAFQTNILALNAAVEAARAGQHGTGFSVVAGEVRSLAARSAEAASETSTLISDSIERASNGLEIARKTQKMLQQIEEGIVNSSTLIDDITKRSQKQVEDINTVNFGIDQVVQVVTQNSAAAEQSAAASEEMNSQATGY